MPPSDTPVIYDSEVKNCVIGNSNNTLAGCSPHLCLPRTGMMVAVIRGEESEGVCWYGGREEMRFRTGDECGGVERVEREEGREEQRNGRWVSAGPVKRWNERGREREKREMKRGKDVDVFGGKKKRGIGYEMRVSVGPINGT